MATRWLKDTWVDALSRLDRWYGDLAVAWAEAPDRAGNWQLLGATIRGGVQAGDIEYRYETLRVRSRMQDPRGIAAMLREGRVLKAMGDREFREVQPTEGQAYWLTSGAVFGMAPPLPTPSYYFSLWIADQDLVSQSQLGQPAYGSGQPYYPTGADALTDVLYGVTRDQRQQYNFNQIVIHLPYTDAYIEGVAYVDGEGMIVSIGQGIHGRANGHRLQALWKIQESELSFRREARILTKAGTATIAMDTEPHDFNASLEDSLGLLVDTIEYRKRYDAGGVNAPLPLGALPEAFDFLASVWLNVFGEHLFQVRRVSPASELTAPVATREDFSSRMSAFGDVMKGIKVGDSLIDLAAAEGLAKDATLGRMKVALEKRLAAPELDTTIQAIGVLQDVVRVRVSLQHQEAKPDLPTSLAKLGIAFPAPWADVWEAIRHRAVTALRDLRNALESAAP